MAKDFFKTFIDGLGDDETSIAADGTSSAESSGFIDSGSYIFNAALNGSIYGGFPNNKAIVLAGDPATGKTFFALGMVKNFLQMNPKGRVFYFDTESAVTNEMMTVRGIDTLRVAKSEPETIERFRTVAIKVLDTYLALDEANRFPLLMVLDSLSALPSSKEVGDITEGKDTKDMTKPGLIKGAFRVLRLKMARAQVPFIVTNHIYSVIGSYVPMKEMAGGSGAKYAADTLVFLSKAKDKDDDKSVRGSLIKVRMVKSRLSREETKVTTRILFDGGLDRYYGLLELAAETGLVKHLANKYEFPNGKKAFEKAILAEPEKFFTTELLDALDVALKPKFTYSADVEAPSEEAGDSDE